MNDTSPDFESRDTLKVEPETRFAAVKARYETLRDELKVRAHLFGMEARDAFNDIEQKAEKLGSQIDAAAHRTLEQLVERLEALRTH